MVVKPEDLWVQNRPEIQSAVMKLEKEIDDHLYQYYTKKGDDVPLLQLDEPLPIVKEIIITKYYDSGWILKIGKEVELGQISIFFSEKPELPEPPITSCPNPNPIIIECHDDNYIITP